MNSLHDAFDALVNALISALSTLKRTKIVQQSLPIKQAELSPQTPQKRIFAIFMDYKNLDDGLSGGTRRFSDFAWLVNPILERGIIAFSFVFIPDNYTGRMEIHQLSDKHRFWPILCTRKVRNAIMKNVDTVDAKMEALGKDIIIHTDVTDLIIISGDADFQELINFAIYRQKRVTVVSAVIARSGRFLEMAKNGKIILENIK